MDIELGVRYETINCMTFSLCLKDNYFNHQTIHPVTYNPFLRVTLIFIRNVHLAVFIKSL